MYRTIIGFSLTLCAAMFSCLLWSSSAHAYPQGPELPFDVGFDQLPALPEIDLSENSTTYAGGHTLNSLELHDYSAEPLTSGLATPPDDGSDLPYSADSFFDVFVDITLDGNLYHAHGVGEESIGIPDDLLPLDTIFDTELLQLDISGGDLPAGVILRESPTQQSSGEANVQDIGGGEFQIKSFFDIFTELSLDGGDTWLPASGTVTLGSTPEPSTIVLLGLGGGLMWIAARRRRACLAYD